MINSLKNIHWGRALLLFAVISLIATIVLRLLTPAEVIVPKTDFIFTEGPSSVRFTNIRFSGSFVQPVTTLPIASVQPSQTTLDFVKNNLIEHYQLQPEIGRDSVWRGETHSLVYDPHSDIFMFYPNDTPWESEELLTNPNLNVATAEQFVREHFPNLELIADRSSIQYLGPEPQYGDVIPWDEVPLSAHEASAVAIEFTYALEGVPVFFDHRRLPVVTVSVDATNTIRSVQFQPYFVHLVPTEQKITLINLETALENINNRNEAAIVSSHEMGAEVIGEYTLDQIVRGDLKTAQLQYRADLNTGLVYPFYYFTGELINDEGKTLFAEIITPAVQTQ